MENSFARIITMLRKERNLSQKQVAEDLGISQALLSHYEKGIRNCSIGLLCKFSDYYNVSCDFLTGKAIDKNGQMLDYNSLPDSSDEISKSINGSAIIPVLNKKILINSISILYSILEEISSKALTNEVTTYLDMAVYKMFREVYSANAENIDCFFSVSDHDLEYLSEITFLKSERNIDSLCKGIPCKEFDDIRKEKIPKLSYDEIDKKYPQYKSSLMSLIKTTEDKILKEI